FQASEIPFYFMHAKLWLLIALARIARDEPCAIARYKNALMRVVDDVSAPHILMRHFAARAIIACIDAGQITVSSKKEHALRSVDASPLPRLHKKLKKSYEDNHGHRPKSAPKPKFSLEYDFS